MKLLFRLVLMLFALGYSASAGAQLQFTATDMYRTAPNATTWRYYTVDCRGSAISTITIAMINNRVVGRTTEVVPSDTLASLGNDPATVTYVFSPGITAYQVTRFVKGITFAQTDDLPGRPQYVRLYVDANKTNLPPGAKITVFGEHPDGSVHYYVWVPGYKSYTTAYNEAKSYYFQGMRGYLPTITSEAEHALLINISQVGGWSAGARSYGHVMDTRYTAKIIEPKLGDSESDIFKWHCGPESGFKYFRGPAHNSPKPGVGTLNNAYSPWTREEPNNGSNEAAQDHRNAEWCMQINFNSPTRGRGWNDLAEDGSQAYISGYYIEFGGNGMAYKVGGAIYPKNPNYERPYKYTDNDQWHQYSPGSTAVSEATVKPTRAMSAHAMVTE